MEALAALLLFPVALRAQLAQSDAPVQAACASAVAAPLPTDISGLPIPKAWPVCDSYSLFGDKDYAGARACAIKERAALLAHLPDVPSPVGGLVVLTELYANAEGVPQNPALAARFLCEGIDTGEVGNGSAATNDILAMLGRLKALTASSPHVAFCNADDPMTPLEDTPNTKYCAELADEAHAEMHSAGIGAGFDSAQADADAADAALKPVLKKLSPAQRAAYSRIAAAMRHFIDVQITGDAIFTGGYGSGGLYPNEEHAAFENQAVAFVNQHPAAPTPADFSAADAALNSAYRDLMAAAEQAATVPDDNVTPDKLRTEQRAWLAYRDAFIAFGRTLDPKRDPEAWALPLTTARTDDLRTVYEVNGKQWIQDAQERRVWSASLVAEHDAETTKYRAAVSEYFDHQSPEQAAAWQRVQDAVKAYAAAHSSAVWNAVPIYDDQQFNRLYSQLNVLRNNDRSGVPVDRARAEAGLAASERRLNEAYQADLASTCLFKAAQIHAQGAYRTAEGLRAEQRAWLKMRDAWEDFFATLFPGQSRAALSNMLTGARAFELDGLHKSFEDPK